MTPNKNGKVLQKSLEFVMLQINFKIKNKLLHLNFELFTLFSSIGVLVSFRGPPSRIYWLYDGADVVRPMFLSLIY